MSPQCQNCESFVTDHYVRVFSREGVEHVACCPQCEDRIRVDGQIRDARTPRKQDSEPTRYDPEKDPYAEVATDGGSDE